MQRIESGMSDRSRRDILIFFTLVISQNMFQDDKKCYIIVEHCFSYKHACNNLLNFDVYFQFQYKEYQEHLH